MYRAGDLMKPPWDDPTAAAWRVYADMLQDCGLNRQKEWLQALRYALGLTRRPKLVLVAYDVLDHRRYCFFPRGSGEWPSQAFTNWRWWTPRYAEPFMDSVFRLENYLATPLDFPGMTTADSDFCRLVCREFVYTAGNGVGRLRLWKGQVIEEVRLGRGMGRRTVDVKPVNWEAEHACR